MAGTQVAMGNTLRPTSELMVGARGDEGDGAFNPATYRRRATATWRRRRGLRGSATVALEHRVWVLLFETFGGFSPACVSLAPHTSLVELPPGDSWSSARAPHR